MLRTTWKMKSDFIHISMSLSIFFFFMLSFYQKWYLMMCLKLPSERWLVSDINNLISSVFFSVRCMCILRSFFTFSLHRCFHQSASWELELELQAAVYSVFFECAKFSFCANEVAHFNTLNIYSCSHFCTIQPVVSAGMLAPYCIFAVWAQLSSD